MRLHEQPGCALAVAHHGRIVLEQAFGRADLARGTPLTPRHRFRAASHTKTFTAAGILKLAEQRRLALGHRAGRYVDDLHPRVARATLAQLLSHGAGLSRDGADARYFVDERPFIDAAELKAELAKPPVLAPGTRFKYSNHGYALLGLVMEAVTAEPWRSWTQREVVEAAGLAHTLADGPPPRGVPLASGHSARLPVGRRLVIPGAYSTGAIAPGGGVVSTAADLARFFALLAPGARPSLLSARSRRAMLRRRLRDPHSRFARWYGLGLMSGELDGWPWFGHSGGLQGYITRTCVLPRQGLALSVLTNAVDGPAHAWMDGLVRLLQAHARYGAPSALTRAWHGRWWTLWGAVDLLPMRRRVLVAVPALADPLADASHLEVRGRDRARIALAAGTASHGEPAHLVRDRGGRVREVWLGATCYRPEAAVAAAMTQCYR